jgi:hypothetical protein
MNELAKSLRRTAFIVATEYQSLVVFLYPCGFSATGAFGGNDILLTETAQVKVTLHMGDNHVSFAHEDPAPRH